MGLAMAVEKSAAYFEKWIFELKVIWGSGDLNTKVNSDLKKNSKGISLNK